MEAVIMWQNCVHVCVCVFVCVRAHTQFVPSVIYSVTVAVCTLLWEHPLCVPWSFLIDSLFRNPVEGDRVGLLNIGSFDPPDGATS